MRSRSAFEQGVTLWELAMTLTLVAVLAGLAVPSFRGAERRAGVRSASDQLFLALHQARSASILRNVPAVVCLSADGARCGVRAGVPADAWIAFLDRSPSNPAVRQPGDELLRAERLPRGIRAWATRTTVTFWPVARAGTTSTFVLCDRERLAEPRSIVVSQSGRPRQAAGDAADCAAVAQ